MCPRCNNTGWVLGWGDDWPMAQSWMACISCAMGGQKVMEQEKRLEVQNRKKID